LSLLVGALHQHKLFNLWKYKYPQMLPPPSSSTQGVANLQIWSTVKKYYKLVWSPCVQISQCCLHIKWLSSCNFFKIGKKVNFSFSSSSIAVIHNITLVQRSSFLTSNYQHHMAELSIAKKLLCIPFQVIEQSFACLNTNLWPLCSRWNYLCIQYPFVPPV